MHKRMKGAYGIVASGLYAHQAVQFGEFFLKKDRGNQNGEPSPIYFNCRITGNPAKEGKVPPWLLEGIVDQMIAVHVRPGFDFVAAVPHGATPYGELLARELDIPLVRLTKRENGDGTTTVDGVEGSPDTQFRYGLLVEDVVTTAASSVEAIGVLRELGCFIEHAVCVVNRQQGGDRRLAKTGVELHTLFTIADLLDHYRARGDINDATFEACHDYLRRQSAAQAHE